MIPTVADAELVISEDNEIGNGSARTVYWNGGEWAYKVEHTHWSCDKSNEIEFEHWQAIQQMELPQGVRVPKMVMLPNGVLAVEYIDGSHPETHCWFADHDCDNARECWYTKLMATGVANIRGFGDISFLNVIMTEGAVYVIDLEI